jgi:hypothetical protein
MITKLEYVKDSVTTVIHDPDAAIKLQFQFGGATKEIHLITAAQRTALLAGLADYKTYAADAGEASFLTHSVALENLKPVHLMPTARDNLGVMIGTLPVEHTMGYFSRPDLDTWTAFLDAIGPYCAGFGEIDSVASAQSVLSYAVGKIMGPHFTTPGRKDQKEWCASDTFSFFLPPDYSQGEFTVESAAKITFQTAIYTGGASLSPRQGFTLSAPLDQTPSYKPRLDLTALNTLAGVTLATRTADHNDYLGPNTNPVTTEAYYAIGVPELCEYMAFEIDTAQSTPTLWVSNDEHNQMRMPSDFLQTCLATLLSYGKISQAEHDAQIAEIADQKIGTNVTLLPSTISIPDTFYTAIDLYADYEGARSQAGEGTPFIDIKADGETTWKTVFNRVKAIDASFLFIMDEELDPSDSSGYELPATSERQVLDLAFDTGMIYYINDQEVTQQDWIDLRNTGEAVLGPGVLDTTVQDNWDTTFGEAFSVTSPYVDQSRAVAKDDTWYRYAPTLDNCCLRGWLNNGLQSPSDFYSSLCATYGLVTNRRAVAGVIASSIVTMHSPV